MIVLSSKEEPTIKAQAFALGANDYLVKLPDKLEVLARIRYHSRGYIALLPDSFGPRGKAHGFDRSSGDCEARREHAGGSTFEIAKRQPHHVPEHRRAQYGIHTIAGVRHQVLADPAQRAAKEDKNRECGCDDKQRAGCLVDDDLVDDDLAA